ncbi:MAG: UDP-N-acetylmuramyl-tripeptide synthetase [Patescibacteria group bacterium]|jgi:UDP-N-acetylmuramoyl-L-alanyl-D-glutamate--2,6-diaminopimelate ligase
MLNAAIYALKKFIKFLLPENMLLGYHRFLASLAAWRYGHPSRKMIVIGVTGTKGKTTTVHLIAQVLMAMGKRVGFTTGVSFRVGDTEWPNMLKMTMPGRLKLQKLLARMRDDGCEYAIIETTSEGIRQYRHYGIEYDMAVLTNMSPEHIESHGSFEKYREAKGRLFSSLIRRPLKHLNDKNIPTYSVLNRDDSTYDFFSHFFADRTTWYSTHDDRNFQEGGLTAQQVVSGETGSTFTIKSTPFSISLLGTHNVYNALAATAACLLLGISLPDIASALKRSAAPAGRLQEIPTKKGFRVFVDYAHEPASLRSAYEALHLLKPKRLIVVLGSQGGGRDVAKRPKLGAVAAEYADVIFITNEDPYDEDPQQIISEVAQGVRSYVGKAVTEGENLFLVPDRGEAIRRAIGKAQAGDVVMISGKGGEKSMAVAGGTLLPWDDVQVVKERL